MAIQLVSYDLRAPEKNYPKLHDYLMSAASWAYPLESFWLVECNITAMALLKGIRGHVDNDDKVVVIDVTGCDWASVNSPQEVVNWMKAKLVKA